MTFNVPILHVFAEFIYFTQTSKTTVIQDKT